MSEGEEQTTARARAKYRGLSTARRTIKLFVASVEMTSFLWMTPLLEVTDFQRKDFRRDLPEWGGFRAVGAVK
jgi:hypothetical protein